MKEKTILVVDDTIANLDILVDLLADYDVIDAASGEDALEIASDEHVDLILLDIMMPGMDGYEVCSRLKSNDRTKDIPVIFITAITGEESIEKAYDIGGADYVTKPFKPKELLSRVKKELRIQDLVSKLKLLASIDPMTKLYNRRYFTQMAQYTFDLQKREGHTLSIIILDIDKFKQINDVYGHQIGDSVIISLADRLLQHKRSSDIACRYGGEEFVLLLPDTSLDNATKLAEKMRQCIESGCLTTEDGQTIHCTVSIGVSRADFTNESDIEHSLKRADDALYEAKAQGRNRIIVKK